MTDIWADLEALPRQSLTQLFDADSDRVAALSADVAGLHFDWSKTHLDAQMIAAFTRLAEQQDFDAHRDALFAGSVVNVTEGRAATHVAERGEGGADDVRQAKMFHARMRALIDAVEAEALGPIRHVLHIGIGGSALGPDLLIDALGREDRRYDVAIVSNVDGCALEEALAGFHPKETLIAIASKTFTTTETLLNAESALDWLREGGVEDPYGQVVALTAAPDKAIEWGVDETRVLPFAEVGRRAVFLMVVDRLSRRDRRWAGTRSRRCWRARRRWTGISGCRIGPRTCRCARPSPISIMRRCAGARRARCSPMTSGCGCCRLSAAAGDGIERQAGDG